MSNNVNFSDEDLVAFLDGALEPEKMQQIEIAISHDVSLVTRLDNLSFNGEEMDAAFGSLLGSAPEAPCFLNTEPAFQSKNRFFGSGTLAACALVFLVMGWGSHALFAGSGPDTWRDYVAAYQVLYVNETLAPVRLSDDQKLQNLVRVSKAIGLQLDFDHVTNVEGFEFKRAQILGFQGKLLIQLAFVSTAGEPFALCILKSPNIVSANVETGLMEGLGAASWAKDGFEFLLIGGAPATDPQKQLAAFRHFL